MKNYRIQTIDVKGDCASWDVHTQEEVLALVQRLLEHGTKYHGDKIFNISIFRSKLTVKR